MASSRATWLISLTRVVLSSTIAAAIARASMGANARTSISMIAVPASVETEIIRPQ